MRDPEQIVAVTPGESDAKHIEKDAAPVKVCVLLSVHQLKFKLTIL